MLKIPRCRRNGKQLGAAVLFVCIAVTCITKVLQRRKWTTITVRLQPGAVDQRCRLSDLAEGPWRRWPRHSQSNFQLVDAHPPAGVHLAGLLLDRSRQLPPPPPYPISASYPIASVGSSAVATVGATLLILVKSAPEHGAARQAIRETWGDPKLWQETGCLVRFILGSPASTRVLAEAEAFEDIIVHGEGDGYRNNTRKLLAGLGWAVRFLPSLRLLLLTDDDLLLNPFVARPLLKAAEAEAKNDGLLAGHLVQGGRPFRPSAGDNNKWSVTLAEYPFDLYPDYLSAGWLLMSARLLPQLIWAAGFVTPRLPFDDVYLGLLAARLRQPLTSLSKLLDLQYDTKLAVAVVNKGGIPWIPRSTRRPIDGLLARHGYSGEAGLTRLRSDWQRLVRENCDGVTAAS